MQEAEAGNPLYSGSKRARPASTPFKKVEGFALHHFGGVWRSIGPSSTPNSNDVWFRPEACLQMARTMGGRRQLWRSGYRLRWSWVGSRVSQGFGSLMLLNQWCTIVLPGRQSIFWGGIPARFQLGDLQNRSPGRGRLPPREVWRAGLDDRRDLVMVECLSNPPVAIVFLFESGPQIVKVFGSKGPGGRLDPHDRRFSDRKHYKVLP